MLFRRTGRWPVIIGKVEMGDAVVEGISQDFHGGGIVARAAKILPEAKADHRQF